MELYSPLKKSLQTLAIAVLGVITLASCSSSQTVYDEDGIYSNPASEAEIVSTDNTGVSRTGVAYKNYFEQKAEALSQIPEEGAIFTDIESYTSTEGDLVDEEYYDDFSEGTGYRSGNASWGEEVSDVTVNVYPSFAGGFGGGFGWNQWGFNRFGWGGFGGGWGYYDPFFGPFYNGWGYGGFGYGYAAWNPFCYGYNRPFYNRPFGNQHFNNGYGRRGNGIAYSRGRRNSASNVIAASRTRLRESSRSRSVYSRSRGTARPSSNRRGDARSNASRPSNSARPSRPNYSRPSSTTRPTRPSTSRPSTTRPNTSRPSRPSTTRPSGNARPASRPSRPNTSRPSSSSRPSYSRPSSSRSSSARSSSSSRSSGSRSSSRSGGSSRRGGSK